MMLAQSANWLLRQRCGGGEAHEMVTFVIVGWMAHTGVAWFVARTARAARVGSYHVLNHGNGRVGVFHRPGVSL